MCTILFWYLWLLIPLFNDINDDDIPVLLIPLFYWCHWYDDDANLWYTSNADTCNAQMQ